MEENMKVKTLSKLSLQKSTVSNLQSINLETIKGGGVTRQTLKQSFCPAACEETELCTMSCAPSCQSINPNCEWTHTCY